MRECYRNPDQAPENPTEMEGIGETDGRRHFLD